MKANHLTAARLLALLVVLSALLNAEAKSEQPLPPLAWRQDPGAIALHSGPDVLWQFNFGSDAAKPYFHPIALPGSPTLTWDRPADHIWHHGFWFSWKYINRLNYWEENIKTGRSAGLTSWSSPSIELRSDFSARIEMSLTYHPPGQPPVLTEKRIIEITPPATDGSWSMDWDMTFTAGPQEVMLDRTPVPPEPESKPYGGYAGLSCRFSRDLQDVRASTTAGPVSLDNNRFGGRSLAFDYSGTLAGRELGIAIFDHPENHETPSPWYVLHGPVMNYFSPAVLFYSPCRLAPGQDLKLRYRITVHPDRWDAARLLQALAR